MTAALSTPLPTANNSAPLVSSGWRPNIDAYEPSLAKAADLAAQFVADMERGSDPYWLTLSGVYGCGKTMLARQIFEQARRINPGNPANNPIWPPDWRETFVKGENRYTGSRPCCLWFDEKDFAKRLKSGEYSLPDDLAGEFLVVFDELGFARDPSNFVGEAIARLCQSRIRGWMVICTNLGFSEINERVDGRVASRLVRDRNKVANITAGDYALVKRRSA